MADTPLRAMDEVERAQLDALPLLREMHLQTRSGSADGEALMTAIVLVRKTLEDAGVLARR